MINSIKYIFLSAEQIEKAIFYLFLALLIWMPLPVGSNRVWFLSIAEVWLFVLAIILLILYWQGSFKLPDVWSKAIIVNYLFVGYLLFIAFQLVPLPSFFVDLISPERLNSYRLIYDDDSWLSLSENHYETFSFFVESIFYYGIFVFTLLLVNSRKRIRLLTWAIIYSALFQAMYGSVMTLSGIEYGFFFEKYTYIGVATGTFINRNHLAGYLNMGIAIGIGVLISNIGKDEVLRTARQWYRKLASLLMSRKAQLRIYLALSTVALVLTHSRMGNVAFFISLTVTALFALKLTQYARKTTLFIVVSIIVIDILIVSAWFGLDKVADRLEKTNIETETRYDVSTYTLDQWKDYFITGSGGGTYQYVFPTYRGAEIKNFYDHAHNDVLEFASETGIIGITLLITIVLMSFYNAVKALSLRRDPLMIGLAFSAMMAILALSIHSFVDFNLHIPANAATFMVILALSWIARFHSLKQK